MTTRPIRLTALATLIAIGLAGCATTPAAKPAKDAKADDSEYEWVTPTGSNIAVKVRKGQKAASTTSPTETMTAEQLGTAVHTSGGAKPAGGN